jgi:hypothetical protein
MVGKQNRSILAVLGIAMVLGGYMLNELFMAIAFERGSFNPPGLLPHPGPIPVGTIWLFLIPVGVIMLVTSIVLEITQR